MEKESKKARAYALCCHLCNSCPEPSAGGVSGLLALLSAPPARFHPPAGLQEKLLPEMGRASHPEEPRLLPRRQKPEELGG